MIYPSQTISEPVKRCPQLCEDGYLFEGEICDENAVICHQCAGNGVVPDMDEINRRAMEAELERMNGEENERWNRGHL